MNSGARVALGLGAGYLLGRTRKMRLALMLAAAGANGRLGGGPRQLLQEGVSRLGSSSEVRELTESVRGDLLNAAKAAAVTAATSRIDALNDRLQASPQQQPRDEAEPQEQAEPPDEAEREDVEDAEDRDQEEPRDEAEREDAGDTQQGDTEQEEQPRSSTRRRTTRPRSKPRTRARSETSAETTDEGETPRRRRTAAATSSGRAPVRRTRK
jgi:hypothetical protein